MLNRLSQTCAAGVMRGKGGQVERCAVLIPLHTLPLILVREHGSRRTLQQRPTSSSPTRFHLIVCCTAHAAVDTRIRCPRFYCTTMPTSSCQGCYLDGTA